MARRLRSLPSARRDVPAAAARGGGRVPATSLDDIGPPGDRGGVDRLQTLAVLSVGVRARAQSMSTARNEIDSELGWLAATCSAVMPPPAANPSARRVGMAASAERAGGGGERNSAHSCGRHRANVRAARGEHPRRLGAPRAALGTACRPLCASTFSRRPRRRAPQSRTPRPITSGSFMGLFPRASSSRSAPRACRRAAPPPRRRPASAARAPRRRACRRTSASVVPSSSRASTSHSNSRTKTRTIAESPRCAAFFYGGTIQNENNERYRVRSVKGTTGRRRRRSRARRARDSCFRQKDEGFFFNRKRKKRARAAAAVAELALRVVCSRIVTATRDAAGSRARVPSAKASSRWRLRAT